MTDFKRGFSRTKVESAKGQSFVDVAFWGGVVPGNSNQLKGCVIVSDGMMVTQMPHNSEVAGLIRAAAIHLKYFNTVVLLSSGVSITCSVGTGLGPSP